ncbi:hypothetical protein OIU77_005633 [Salix suchowensis]|uniref:Epidermal patterning factor-like protein n=2 Tax=Salix TaxID=40685 RepID=A0A9Q0W4Q0_9ROSI|nr:hypothetical protein OIU78_024237 [Salix suchowensis]KAJ6355079.1 hypothetical protein OIU77_005633 [Salix suchowensis]KAJ6758980.1 EPIDERMAL PATTERNING FACTOR-LIKE PROTEIN [Salix koriyanagi]
MASVTDSSSGTRITFIVILFFSLALPPPISVGSSIPSRGSEDMKQQKKMILGSRPPRCVNRCLNCNPCMAALVTPPHHKNGVRGTASKGDESYYLLSWKCKCGDKYFQP